MASVVRWAGRAALVMGVAYLLASVLSAVLMAGMLTSAVGVFNIMSQKKQTGTSVNIDPSTNYREITKAIHERNLFNSAGDYPEEKTSEGAGDEGHTSAFDINAPCNKPSVNIELIGTIFLDGDTSVATVQEQGYSESDVYREGDLIIGNEQASVVKIQRNRIILNNRGVKECLDLAAEKTKKGPEPFPAAGAGGAGTAGAGGAGGGGRDCTLDEKYVHDELGPGFGTIIQKARLVPNTVDNQMNGFKIFAIDMSSLYGKTGLQNGDVITQVNETSLKLPEQGFALLQSFQDEKEVRIHILRNGTQPMMLTCHIK